jgi:MSHA biogenesis protein MshL
VSMSPQSGIIIVTAMPHELRKIEEFLEKMQGSLNRQVILEAKILEVTLSNSNQQGIDWNKVSGRLNLAQIGGGSTLSGSGSSTATSVSRSAGSPVDVNGAGASFPNISADQLFGGVFSATLQLHNFGAFLELLSEQGNVQVLSSPRVSTMNNQQAIIKIGTDAYYVTNVTNSSTNNGGNASTNSSNITLTPFFSGIALDVTPFVDEQDNVTLHVHPTITVVSTANVTVTLNGQNQVLPLAQNNVRESDTVIRSRSGQIVIIGGLMKNETVEVSTSIPYIDKIPFFGNLTRQKQQQKLKSELVILLRPIVTRVDNYDSILKDAQRRLQEVNRGFYSGPNPEMFGNIRETQRLP